MQKPIALVTGASGGIGSAIAKRLAADGFAVVLHSYSHMEIAKNAAHSFPENADYLIVSCDLTNPLETERMISFIHSSFGKVSILVNCAGVAIPQKLFTETTDQEFDKIFQLNVSAMMRLTRLLLNDIRTNSGSIINISSMWGLTGASCEVIYSASKAAVIGFTKALAKELAPSGVTVNAIAPGFVQTEMNAHLSADERESFRQSTPLERFGAPEEIAEAVSYLVGAHFMTGQVLSVDGGIVI